MSKYSFLCWDRINAGEFEQLCQAILGSLGFANLVRIGGSGDRGRDIVCNLTINVGKNLSFMTNWVVQCKHYCYSPTVSKLKDDLTKALQHEPDFWLLMTSASPLSPSVHDWLRAVEKKQFSFRILVMDGVEISRIILQRPVLAHDMMDRLFTDDRLETRQIMALMGKRHYDKALTTIQGFQGRATPRMAYLEACCRSMLAQRSKQNRTENVEKAFAALKEALGSGYLTQMNLTLGWPPEKVLYEIQSDPELQFLKDQDLSCFIKTLEASGYATRGEGGGCFVADTPIRFPEGIEKPISSVEVGDIVAVPSRPSKGAFVIGVSHVNENCVVSINDRVWCSLSQSLLTTWGWKRAVALQYGDILLGYPIIEPVVSLRYEQNTYEVYMIRLAEEHVFYASDYIAHNKLMID